MKNIVLQGLPGVGKTTLVKKVVNTLKEMKCEISGFYTEEVRSNNCRIGFDVVTVDNQRRPLARKSGSSSSTDSQFKVGAYSVCLQDFENIALPALANVTSGCVIDEVGKMEMFSKSFQTAVEKIICDKTVKVLVTVPLKGGAPLVQRLKSDQNFRTITVTPENRDGLLQEIISLFASNNS